MNQDFSRKIVYVSVLFAALLYVLVAVILIIGTGFSISDFQVPFIVLSSSVGVSIFISLIFLSNKWKLDEGVDIAKQLVKDLVVLAMIHMIAILGLMYFILSFTEVI